MNLFDIFSKHAPNKIFIAILGGVFSGFAYAMLIPVIMTALSTPPAGLNIEDGNATQIFGISVANPKYAAIFLALCVFILVLRTTSQVLIVRITMDVTTKLRKSLYSRISDTSIPHLEKNTDGRLIQAMTTDVQRIVSGASIIPDLMVHISSVLGLMCFLVYLNTQVFIFVIFVVVFGLVTYQLPALFGIRYFERARQHMDALQDGFNGLIDGAKELKVNNDKRQHFMKERLLAEEEKVIGYEKKGITVIKISQSYGDLISFITMGAVGFIYVNYHAVSVSELVGVIMVLLYLAGPVASIINAVPELATAKISLKKFYSLFDDLPQEPVNKNIINVPEWNTIILDSVTYHHESVSDNFSGFSIGPVSAKVKRGEITFIVGGNGCGKSTFLKTVSLHYPAFSGEIRFDNVTISKENINSYRQQIACIYSDYYLFDQLHNEYSRNPDIIDQVEYYLDLLELTDKVKYIDGRFSTLKLSDGQRRRLALLVAFIDNKSLYVFDEWAADQDPHFKEVFYFNILPKLKSQGKAIVAISHDDRYFHVADQVLVMDSGKLVNKHSAHSRENLNVEIA